PAAEAAGQPAAGPAAARPSTASGLRTAPGLPGPAPAAGPPPPRRPGSPPPCGSEHPSYLLLPAQLIQQVPQVVQFPLLQPVLGQGRQKIAGGTAVQLGEHCPAVKGQVVLPAHQGSVEVVLSLPADGHKSLFRQAGQIGI